MRVVLLSPYPQLIEEPIRTAGDTVVSQNAPPRELDLNADIIVSFGYRHILKPDLLNKVKGPILNIHASYLPWNRGADPNFWSWFEETPKGVSIHSVDAGIDTGPILVQSEVEFANPQSETLSTTYRKLQARAISLFAENWAAIRSNEIVAKPQKGGSFHRGRDKERWWSLLPKGYDTPVAYVAEIGVKHAVAVGMRGERSS